MRFSVVWSTDFQSLGAGSPRTETNIMVGTLAIYLTAVYRSISIANQ